MAHLSAAKYDFFLSFDQKVTHIYEQMIYKRKQGNYVYSNISNPLSFSEI
jgi:hypothetical protein